MASNHKSSPPSHQSNNHDDNIVAGTSSTGNDLDKDVSPRLNKSNSHTKLDKRPTVTFSIANDHQNSTDDNHLYFDKQSTSVPSSETSTARSPRTSSLKKNVSAGGGQEDIASTFMRTDSILIRVKAGETFTEYAAIVVEAKYDQRLGTLGELRHHLRTGTKNQVKKFLRHNHWTSGHRIRAELWKELCKDANVEAQREVYKETVAKLDKGIVLKPTMLSVPNLVMCDHQLKENGKVVLMRLLTVIEHVRPDFTYIPVLYPLVALFLHYMNEEDAFACIMKLLSHSQKFLLQTDIAASASKRTLLVLVKKHISRAYVLFKKLTATQDDRDLIPIFDDWKNWLFRDLPFSHLVRVVDCFLYEGQKVLFRVAMAIIVVWSKEAGKRLKQQTKYTCKEISNDISNFCHTIPAAAPKLLKTAFSIRNLKMSYIRRLQEKHEMKIRSRDSGLAQIVSDHNIKSMAAAHHFIESHFKTPSEILNQNQSMEIVKMMPPRFQLSALSCIFSLNKEGTSLTRFWQKVDDFAPTVLLIKTSKEEIFGAFCSEAWNIRKKSTRLTYFGTGESFLFKFLPEPCKYSWVGMKKSSVEHQEELFQAADAITLIIGGGAISIQNSLESGSSERSPTFDSPPLSCSVDFNIKMLEVFGFVEEEA